MNCISYYTISDTCCHWAWGHVCARFVTVMLSKTEFAQQVTDAYGHLYDLVYLRTHPLIDILIPDHSLPRKEKAWQVHHLLLDVIGELEPDRQLPVLSRPWRRHRLMVMRYVKALEPDAVAEQLNIGRRHYYREHKIAVETVADILWDRHVVHRTTQQTPGSTGEQEPVNHLELLRLEAARIAQADRYACIEDVLTGVMPIIQERLRQRRLDFRPVLPQALPGVSIGQSLLRQMLLGMLGGLMECAEQAEIRLTAQVEGTTIHLALTVEPKEAIQPTQQADIEEHFATFTEMAALGRVNILPVRAGQCIVGFDVQLPTVERTILIVDDNEDVLELFQRYLSARHYRVVTARAATEALEKTHQIQPYAITLDLMMPGRDGWDLLQTLINQPDTRHIPVFVCSVLKQKELALSLGATAFLEKPVTEQMLLSVLDVLEKA
jgi:CheY-like chemotaxis protein